jgi:hypothetical protein
MREREHLEDLVVDGRIMLKQTLRTSNEWSWTGLISLGIGTGDRFL